MSCPSSRSMRRLLSLGSLIGLLFPLLASAVPSVYPTGVTRYDPARAYNGYVLFAGADQKTHLIDMNGNEVRRWEYRGFPSVPLTPAQAGGKRGHVLLQLEAFDKPAEFSSPGNGLSNRVIGEVDWDDKVVWQWGQDGIPENGVQQHHDMRRLPNGNTLVLAAKVVPLEGFTAKRVIDNLIYEVTPEGKIVWQWAVSDHLDELGFSPEQLERVRKANDPDFLHLNTTVPVGPNRWAAAGDERFAPDNLIVNSRNANLAFIVDRKTGKVVWRLGPDLPPLTLERLADIPRALDQFVGAHDVHMIPDGRPGAGNVLIFDNGGNAGFPPAQQPVFAFSRVIEVDPVSKEILWQYTAPMSGQPVWSFFSAHISSARRLPNGNTLIDEGANGRMFQVTRTGDIVWEYVSPYFGKSTPSDNYLTNSAYRAELVDYDWAPNGTPRSEQPVTPSGPPPAVKQ